MWQRSFHDRGLRDPSAIDRAIAYVVSNPVRTGLVSKWEEYPYIGGSAVREVGDEGL